jgi:hypothetical protein
MKWQQAINKMNGAKVEKGNYVAGAGTIARYNGASGRGRTKSQPGRTFIKIRV